MNHRLKTYDYTPEGRLSRRTWARTATYAYDHRGRIVRKGISRGVGGLLAVIRSEPATNNSSLVTRSSSLYFPAYDANGNQTLIQTETGIWSVIYNGENRPVLWSNGITNMVMAYDRMGRRVVKNSQRFSYDGYLQIADNNGNAYAWDPTEPVATRPLVWSHGGKKSYYFHDGNKNVTDVMAEDSSHYNYAPFGECAETYSVDCNPWRFSSEFFDSISLMVYYNYRHYSVISGRWSNIDPLQNQVNDKNLASEHRNEPATCLYLRNDPVLGNDVLGLKPDKKRGPSKPFPHMPIDRESCNSEQIGKINESIELLRTKIDRRRFTADFYKCLCESGLRRYTIDNLLTALMGGSQKEIHCAKNCHEGRSGFVCTGVKPLPPECQGNVDPKSVYICPIAFDFSMEELAKTIFHELIHVIGEDNSRHKYIYAAEKCLIFGEDKPTHDITIPEFPDPYSIECQSCK